MLVYNNRSSIRAYIASEKINVSITAYGVCVPVGSKKIISFGTVPGNQRVYAQMVALDNFLTAVDEAGFSKSSLQAVLLRDALRQRLENVRSRKALVDLGQSVRELTEDPDRWEEMSMRAAEVTFALPSKDADKFELEFIEKQLQRTYVSPVRLVDGLRTPREARLSFDISEAVPLPNNCDYLLSKGSFGNQ